MSVGSRLIRILGLSKPGVDEFADCPAVETVGFERGFRQPFDALQNVWLVMVIGFRGGLQEVLRDERLLRVQGGGDDDDERCCDESFHVHGLSF